MKRYLTDKSRLVHAVAITLSGILLSSCGGSNPRMLNTDATVTAIVSVSHLTPVGTIDGLMGLPSCDAFGGWVWDRSKPDTPITVEIYEMSTLLESITADRFGQDLLDAHIGDGKHAFAFSIPSSLKDRQPHLIRVKVAKTDIELRNSSRFISCPPE